LLELGAYSGPDVIGNMTIEDPLSPTTSPKAVVVEKIEIPVPDGIARPA